MASLKVVVPMAMAVLLALAHVFVLTLAADTVPTNFNHSYFPPGFLFGASASAYQTEGAWRAYGKGPSIWDYFSHKHSNRINGGTNGDVATDFYHRYTEDIKMLKETGFRVFRFSISWPRLLPFGKRSKGVNQHGVDFYNNVINKVLENGIEPWVTIYHWDVPLALEKQYGGLRSNKIVDDYLDFARLCFELFGDRVKHWMTINEPGIASILGYAVGSLAPGRCSCIPDPFCAPGNGDAGREPYLVMHHLLLSHSAAVQEYRKNFKAKQGGKLGLSLQSNWFLPVNKSQAAQQAVNNSIDWNLGWQISPLIYGKYPDSMRKSLGNRLPEFTEQEKNLLIRSFDFIGLNYYKAYYAVPTPEIYNASCLNFFNDWNVTSNGTIYGSNPDGLRQGNVYPKGLRFLLNYIKNHYGDPAIVITENGVVDMDNSGIHDNARITFFQEHIWQVYNAVRENGVDVKGYILWSLTDSFEWSSGYGTRMGIIQINYEKNLTRTYKNSSRWFKKFLKPTGKQAEEPNKH